MTQSAIPVPAAMSPGRIRAVVALAASVQFYAALEGSMLLPLGPTLAARLNFPVEHLGYVNGSFLVSAAIAGIIGSLCLDRFDRRFALSVALAGLALGTAAAGFSNSLAMLLTCRILAGLCGGPAVALALAVISDATPVEVRGRAISMASAGSSLALILGVPAALLISELASWRGAFFIIGGVGVALAISAATFLPSGLGRRSQGSGVAAALSDFAAMLGRPNTLLAMLNGALALSSINILAANLAPAFVYNLGVPESHLKYLWGAGGLSGLISGQIFGRLSDRLGPAKVMWGVSLVAAALYYLMFVLGGLGVPAIGLMCVFLACATGRIMMTNTINSLTPGPDQRGRFMSLMSSSNQASSAAAVFVSSIVLTTGPGGRLLHMDTLAYYGIFACLAGPMVATALAARLRRQAH